MNKCVTLTDVAQRAGVGKGTVDRVLHNRGRVSEETRQKVLQVMEELQYRPNTAAQMLKKKRVYRIAVIYHNYEIEFWKQVEQGIEQAQMQYAPMGVQVERLVLPRIEPEKQAEILKKVISEGYDGIAVVPYSAEAITEVINEAVEKGIPVITFNNDEECKRMSYVGQDLYQSGRTAGKLMALMAKPEARYVSMAPICNEMSKLVRRMDGFNDVLQELRKDMVCVGKFQFNEDIKLAYDLTRNLMQNEKVDAIYVSNVMVENVANALEDLGIGQDVLVIGHDNTSQIMNYISKGIIDVSIGQEPERQGFLAVEKLCRRLLLDEEIQEDVYTKIEIITSENMKYLA